jgi:hypothetical protein
VVRVIRGQGRILVAWGAADAYNNRHTHPRGEIPGIRHPFNVRFPMQSLLRLALLAAVILVGFEVAHADVAASAPGSTAIGSGSGIELPHVLGQYSSDSSSSSSTRVPRGAIRLAIFAVIALLGAGSWVVKKMTAG